ncbi:unnamed protein product, partial [Trichobilharzia regenti]
MSTNDNWCLIESDPGVFSELIKGFGVESLECEEVYDLYETSSVSDAYGFIFLFSYDDKQEDMGKVILDENRKGIFFAKQTISNACATQAIINKYDGDPYGFCDKVNHEIPLSDP